MLLKKTSIFALLILSTLTLSSCGGSGGSDSAADNTEEDSTETDTDTDNEVVAVDISYFIEPDHHEEIGDYSWESDDETLIDLLGNTVAITGEGASANGSDITITDPGTYRLTGPLNDGQIIVDANIDEALVRLIFDGIDISNSTGAAINIQEAEKTIIILEENTFNVVSDAMVYEFEDPEEDEPNATIFSKDDLSIYGNGSLTVNANYNDGITSKDGLVINSGNIIVNAEDDGLRGKDYLVISGGNITIHSIGDGMKSDDDDEGKGYISISAGIINITSSDGDAIQAESNIQISGGDFTLLSGGGNTLIAGDSSTKGLKAKINLFIEGGLFSIDSSDDAIHADNGITITGGIFNLTTGDDGIHSDVGILISDGDITIEKSYEGIESAVITIDGGNISLVSSDDGINIAGGVDGSSTSNYNLYINGGFIVVDATGDGIDSNGNITMSGGTVLVHGPTANFNSPLDFDGSFTISGGLLVAVGSAGMAQAPVSSSSQMALGVSLGSNIAPGQLMHIQDSEGVNLLTFSTKKNAASLVFSAPELEANVDYSFYSGGSSTGSESGGLYSDGSYTPGDLEFNFSFSTSGALTITN